MATIGVIGVGSIGSVLARGFDQLGHDVIIHDKNSEREAALDFSAIEPDPMMAQAKAVFVAVPTPTTDQGGDASAVAAVIDDLADADGDATVCIRSTMPPGETAPLANRYDMPLVCSPEFLRDRSGVDDFFHPDRIVLAGPKAERAVVRDVLDDESIQCDTFIQMDDYLTAEIGKEAHNAFFATKVSFANQMRLICEQEGADVETVQDIVTADHRNTNSHMDPLLGAFGGKCLPKDTKALTLYGERLGAPTDQLRATLSINQHARKEFENAEIAGEWPDISVRGD